MPSARNLMDPTGGDQQLHQQLQDERQHRKRSKGRTGWPQDVWALELKPEQV